MSWRGVWHDVNIFGRSIVEQGGFNTKGTMGNKFRDWLAANPSEAGKYKAFKRGEAQQYRLDWTKKELSKVEEQRSHLQSWKRIDKTKGVYKSMGALIVDMGGWKCREALEGTATLAAKCNMMGPPWVIQHPQTNITEYLHLRFEWCEEFSEQWDIFRNFVKPDAEAGAAKTLPEGHAQAQALGQGLASANAAQGGQALAATGAAGTHAQSSKGGTKPAAAKGKGRATQPAAAEGADSDSQPLVAPNGKKPRSNAEKQFSTSLREANVLKLDFHKACSDYIAIVAEIEQDQKLKWISSSPGFGSLQAASKVVRAHVSAYGKQFIQMEWKDLRLLHKQEKHTVEMCNFLSMKSNVADLLAKIKMMRQVIDACNSMTETGTVFAKDGKRIE